MAVSPALRRLGMMTPWAPAHSAVRRIAPRLWGSDISSHTTSSGASPLSAADLQDLLHRGVFPHGGQRDHPLVGVGAAHVVQLPPVGLHHHDARGRALEAMCPRVLSVSPLAI